MITESIPGIRRKEGYIHERVQFIDTNGLKSLKLALVLVVLGRYKMPAEEISRVIGKSVGVRMFEVEKGAIRRFADAVGDANPLFRDVEYARQSPYGEIIAPPGFFGWPLKQPMGSPLVVEFPAELMEPLSKSGYTVSSALDGGMEYDFYLPVHAGDTLTESTTVKDVRERSGRAGKMCFIVLETIYINQNGDLVARASATMILRSLSI